MEETLEVDETKTSDFFDDVPFVPNPCSQRTVDTRRSLKLDLITSTSTFGSSPLKLTSRLLGPDREGSYTD